MSANPSTTLGFHDFALSPPLLQTLAEIGYESPSPIQAQTIPFLLEGHDLLGQAQTGSGKTAAFALPILSRIQWDQKKTQAIILTPTRELTIQVCEAVKQYGKGFKDLKVLSIYGGQSYDIQIQALRKNPQILVGTPGRVMDLLRKGLLDLSQLSFLVLDEADEMLNMGFIEDVEWIIKHTPKTRQTILFSATMPAPIQKISQQHLKSPKEIRIKDKTATASSIHQKYLVAPRGQKTNVLIRLLEVEPFDGMIIFARTKSMTLELAEKLVQAGYRTLALNGEIPQAMREKTIARFKQGAFDIIVATDVAARGLDVDRITHVINYDLPHDALTYIHRIGRTGRAGRQGEALSLIYNYEQRDIRTIEHTTKQKIQPIQPPSDQEVHTRRLNKFQQKLSDSLLNLKDNDFYKNFITDFCKQNQCSSLDVSAALASLLYVNKPVAPLASPSHEAKNFSNDRRSKNRFEEKSNRRDKKEKNSFGKADASMRRYNISVGKKHGVMPGNIVGAIANEISLNSKKIGHIKIYESHSTVDLPKDLPNKSLELLSKVWVAGQQLKIARE